MLHGPVVSAPSSLASEVIAEVTFGHAVSFRHATLPPARRGPADRCAPGGVARWLRAREE